MNKKYLGWPIVLFALVVAGLAYGFWEQRAQAPTFVTAPVAEGNITSVVVTTGTLSPVTTVQVGTYVSGTIQSLFCDYNTRVKAGQICAKIDPRPYQVIYDQTIANLAGAEAQLKKDQANLAYVQITYNRNVGLQKKGVVTQDSLDSQKSVFDQAMAQVEVDKAFIKEKQATVEAAKVNLDYTDIASPVDGTVVSRSVDVGQTVAASFQTPTLFLIAKDLTQMQVDTNVSEADIGGVREGQKATFVVEAYPDKIFEGKVIQVRKAPIAVQNIVTYDVVIGVDNPDFILLPGMTANMRIIAAEHNKVLNVPAQALRFSPQDHEPAANQDEQSVYLLRDGKPARVPVKIGLSDGTNTEIAADGIKAGDEVIINEIKPAQTNGQAAGPPRSPLRF